MNFCIRLFVENLVFFDDVIGAMGMFIDQFQVLQYCFLNDALCLCGSYDCT